jgi:hypothetical protein
MLGILLLLLLIILVQFPPAAVASRGSSRLVEFISDIESVTDTSRGSIVHRKG